MRLLARAFLYGVGFVAGSTVTGALIGYGLGKLAEHQVGKLLREASNYSDGSRDDQCGNMYGEIVCTRPSNHLGRHMSDDGDDWRGDDRA